MKRQTKSRVTLGEVGLYLLAAIGITMADVWLAFPGGSRWLATAGVLVWPIVAFLAVEGWCYACSERKYFWCWFLLALISEVPFDLMSEGVWFDPWQQNLWWTLLIGLLGIAAMERFQLLKRRWLVVMLDGLVMVATYVLATIGFVQYHGVGVLTVYVFYVFRGWRGWDFWGQLLSLLGISVFLGQGFFYPVALGSLSLAVPEQLTALAALPVIWLLGGASNNNHCRWWQWWYIWYYPVQLLVLFWWAHF